MSDNKEVLLEDVKLDVKLESNLDLKLESHLDDLKSNEIVELNPENVLIDGVEHLYTHIKAIHSERVTAVNVVLIATELMMVVEKYKNLTGKQKKMLVVNVIKKLVNSQVDTLEERNALNIIIDFTLPIVIDNLVSAVNGQFTFNKEKTVTFFKKYICCCFK